MSEAVTAPVTIPSRDRLRETWAKLAGQLVPATFVESERLDRAIGSDCRVVLVLETFQHTGSFKYRAALSAALASRSSRLLTASSGNFGAALALAATRAGKSCTVVMPAASATIKIEAVRSHGATVDLVDTTVTTRAARVAELAATDAGAQVLSAYDDPDVICGNSSLGREIFEKLDGPREAIVVPVGGGGLSSGIVLARDLFGASVRVIGAEPALANDAARSLRAGSLQASEREAPTICDGARTLSLGRLNYAILSRGLGGIVEVSEENVKRAMRLLFSAANVKAEPTGALALAAVLESPDLFAGKRVVCIVSGGNVDPELYARVIEGK